MQEPYDFGYVPVEVRSAEEVLFRSILEASEGLALITSENGKMLVRFPWSQKERAEEALKDLLAEEICFAVGEFKLGDGFDSESAADA